MADTPRLLRALGRVDFLILDGTRLGRPLVRVPAGALGVWADSSHRMGSPR
jgi:hypothetical protein